MELKKYKLKDICNRITDGSHYSPKEQSSGYPMFSVKDMDEFYFSYDSNIPTDVNLLLYTTFLYQTYLSFHL